MAKDSKLPEIEIKRQDFRTDEQREAAENMLETWNEEGPTSFSELADRFGYSDSMYSKIMNRHMGPVDHDITVEEIRARYGSVTEYLEERKKDTIDTDTRELSERELDLFKEGYREGYRDGLEDAN